MEIYFSTRDFEREEYMLRAAQLRPFLFICHIYRLEFVPPAPAIEVLLKIRPMGCSVSIFDPQIFPTISYQMAMHRHTAILYRSHSPLVTGEGLHDEHCFTLFCSLHPGAHLNLSVDGRLYMKKLRVVVLKNSESWPDWIPFYSGDWAQTQHSEWTIER